MIAAKRRELFLSSLSSPEMKEREKKEE